MTRRELVRLVRASLRELDLRSRVADAVRASVRDDRLGERGLVRVIAIGKAAPAMARGALEALGPRAGRTLVVTNEGHAPSPGVLVASHPLPDARSVRAGRAALALAASDADADRSDLLVLVSGGASSLACVPADGVTLATKRDIASAMLRSGADVRRVNVVRRHLSSIKGGGLARAAWPDRTFTIVASDVLGGTASDVGSGPSLPDPSTVTEARRLLARYAPSHRDTRLVRTLSPADRRAGAVMRARVVASPEELASVCARRLRATGLEVHELRASTDSASDLAREILDHAARASRGIALVRAAEPGVLVPARAGRGGRATHIAALVGRDLGRLGSRALFAAIATDGVDGRSGTSGAVVDRRFASHVASRLGDGALERAIADFDAGPVHAAARTALPERPTGHNLADLHVLVLG